MTEWQKFVDRRYSEVTPARVVMACREGESVKFYPNGGGFERVMTDDAFEEMFRPMSDEEYREITTFKRVTVMLDCEEDDSKKLAAWTRGETWNGWATPWFERDVLEAAIAAGYFMMEGELEVRYESNRDAFVVVEPCYDDDTVVEGENVETPEGMKRLYRLGEGWTWIVVE